MRRLNYHAVLPLALSLRYPCKWLPGARNHPPYPQGTLLPDSYFTSMPNESCQCLLAPSRRFRGYVPTEPAMTCPVLLGRPRLVGPAIREPQSCHPLGCSGYAGLAAEGDDFSPCPIQLGGLCTTENTSRASGRSRTYNLAAKRHCSTNLDGS